MELAGSSMWSLWQSMGGDGGFAATSLKTVAVLPRLVYELVTVLSQFSMFLT